MRDCPARFSGDDPGKIGPTGFLNVEWGRCPPKKQERGCIFRDRRAERGA
jgi:hypothetical protein